MDTPRTNALGQPIGEDVPGWAGATPPPRTPMTGRWTILEPLDPARHGDDLWRLWSEDREGRIWTYLSHGPFADRAGFDAWIAGAAAGTDPQFHAIRDRISGETMGVASFLRIDPRNGVIEVGHINYAPRLQKTVQATEAMFVMMARVFDELGYRRYEWKCDSLNAPSRRAAQRLGFTYDGLFRQAIIYKGRNRDTTWFSILDRDWPALKCAYLAWLDIDNFHPDGMQKRSLADLIAEARAG